MTTSFLHQSLKLTHVVRQEPHPPKRVSMAPVVIFGGLLLSLMLIGCKPQQTPESTFPPPTIMGGSTMGTNWKVTVPYRSLPKGMTNEAILAKIKQQLTDINSKMSTYLPNSEVSRFNKSTSTDWFPVSTETAKVITEAQRISKLSDGAFDITVAPLVNLWNFGPEIHSQQLPDETTISKAMKQIGYQKLNVQLQPAAIKKEIATLQIDLSAIAKGYAVDEVARLLTELKIDNYLVDIGGEVIAKGVKDDGKKWQLGVEAPIANERKVYQIIPLKDHAIATSGDYRNFREIAGKRYSHTIDPRTGKPVEHTLTSASVITNSCMTADAFATTLMVLGPKAGFVFAKEQQLDVMLIERDGSKLSDQKTDGFTKFLSPKIPVTPKSKPKNSMMIFVISFVVFGIAMVGMAIGYLLKNKCLKGSCGGLSTMTDSEGKPLCESCTSPSPECEQLAKVHEETKAKSP